MRVSTPAAGLPSPTQNPALEISPRRPILKRKGTSRNSSFLGAGRIVSQEIVEPPKPDMAASFLQFCAMCEKQIMTPCNSVLYCSEACRRKDSAKPLAAAIISSTPVEGISPPPSEPSSPKPILSPRVPTGVTVPSSPSVISIPAELHDHKSDLDPTEWKPKLPERSQSEAFRYLSRFHRSITTLDGVSSDSEPHTPTTTMIMPTPSLGNTPTTTASSSLSTSASFASRYVGTSHNGYDFNTRPLPTRPNRWYSFNGGTPKGVDLVTPHVVPPVAAPPSPLNMGRLIETGGPTTLIDDEDLRWEKRKVKFTVPAVGDDGLSVLFADRK